ncbi:MAG: hypothetical protein JRG97_09100 [Deltaproteobacteria bacterium]|nr:hypothetical protein [Deltaproteobacteria bacterium]MBW2141215.1 hypothetical protein [Deltaproteobacteria bacterium]
MAKKQKWKFGKKIDFRNLTYAPINELGVVFLFALFHESLKLHIEGIQQSFPDCKAKRQLPNGGWEEVLIEFEYESKSFVYHKHDPGLVDMIVCWKHNWEAVPNHIEVIELSTFLKETDDSAPKTRLTEYQKFSQKMRLAGYDFKQIAKLWRERKKLPKNKKSIVS